MKGAKKIKSVALGVICDVVQDILQFQKIIRFRGRRMNVIPCTPTWKVRSKLATIFTELINAQRKILVLFNHAVSYWAHIASVICEWIPSIGGLLLTGKTGITRKKILRHGHFVHHKSHKHWPGNYRGLCGERPAVNSLVHGRPSQTVLCAKIYYSEFHLDRK